MVDIIEKVRDAVVRRKVGCEIRRTARGRRVRRVRRIGDWSWLGDAREEMDRSLIISVMFDRLEVAGRSGIEDDRQLPDWGFGWLLRIFYHGTYI